MSNSASKWLTQLYMLTPGKDPWHSVFRSELVSSRITHTHALVMLVLHFDRTQHWRSPGRCSKRELCSRTRMRRWERNEHTFRSVQMIGSSSREKRVTSVSPERDRNIHSGMIIQPAETLSSYVSLHSDRRRNFTCQRDQHQLLGNLGRELVTQVTAVRCESEESSRLAENLNCEIRTLRLSLPLCCRTSNTLGRYSVIFVRRVRAKPICYDWCLHAGAYKA